MSRWRWTAVAVAVALVLGSGGYAVAQARETDPSYRTARATIGDVERTLELSGTVTKAGRRDLSFGAAGRVARVAVRAGQRVRSGQVLGQLDRTPFDAAVTAALATLAKARAQLAADKEAQADTVSDSSSDTDTGSRVPSSGSGKPRGKTPVAGIDPALQQLLAQLAAEQVAVTRAQSDASEAITAAKVALAEQAEACRAEPRPDPSPDPAPTASPTGSATGAPTGSVPDGRSTTEPAGYRSRVSSGCTEALSRVQAAQDAVAAKQETLRSALAALGETLGVAVKAVSRPQSQPPAQNQNQNQNQNQEPQADQSTDAGETQDRSGGGSAVTAARLAQDQADIDTAEARLTQARAEREAATLRAPYSGRILQVDLARGDLVTASDTAFVLVGTGATTVTTTVSTAQVPSVRRGQRVRVVPAGWTTSLAGTVSAVALLPDSDGAFSVTVTVTSTRAVAEGAGASVSIVTGSVKDAVTVPVSALNRTGERATVQVLSGGTVRQTSVSVGVVGARRVSITQGLDRGATVVLADLEAAVPSGDAGQGPRFGGPGGGPGGGGPGTTTFIRPAGG